MDRTGFNFERFRKHNPRLVMTSITPYGLTGPYRDRLAEELTLWSQGGLTYLNGAGPDSREIPPLKAFGQQAGYQGGIHGAVATVGAMMAQLRDGEGQHIDVSVYEVCASMLELTYVYWPYGKRVASRLGAKPVQPLEALECKDGIIFLCCVEDHQWKAFVELMGHPAWTDEELFRGRGRRTANWDAARPLRPGMAQRSNRSGPLPQGAGQADSVRACIDHGRPAEFRPSQGARLFR